jgi:hypothetical protein
MILPFSKQRFVDAILHGSKIHTIRRDAGSRWQPGRKIHFWFGNPRNVSKNPYCFAEGICSKTEPVRIVNDPQAEHGLRISVNGENLHSEVMVRLIQNDGLETASFRKWFVPKEGDIFEGKIIYWKDIIRKS